MQCTGPCFVKIRCPLGLGFRVPRNGKQKDAESWCRVRMHLDSVLVLLFLLNVKILSACWGICGGFTYCCNGNTCHSRMKLVLD